MNKTFAVISNDIVENVIVANDEFAQEIATSQGKIVVEVPTTPGSPGIGWSYINGEFSAPQLTE